METLANTIEKCVFFALKKGSIECYKYIIVIFKGSEVLCQYPGKIHGNLFPNNIYNNSIPFAFLNNLNTDVDTNIHW